MHTQAAVKIKYEEDGNRDFGSAETKAAASASVPLEEHFHEKRSLEPGEVPPPPPPPPPESRALADEPIRILATSSFSEPRLTAFTIEDAAVAVPKVLVKKTEEEENPDIYEYKVAKVKEIDPPPIILDGQVSKLESYINTPSLVNGFKMGTGRIESCP